MMPTEFSFVAAIMVGLLGSTHCVGMCGGIVSALSQGLSDPARNTKALLLKHLLAYNAGRILSYTLIGALAGLVGAGVSELNPLPSLPIGAFIASIFMVALGMYLANWWRILSILEGMGAFVWRKIEPWGRRWLPVSNPLQAFGLGIIWGWLPCGLVYAVVAWSLTTGNMQQGAILMLGFGLGTLPTLVLMGVATAQLRHIIQRQAVRTTAGIIIIVFGVYTGYVGLTQ